jgi:pre-mRNA-splicing helicase BRR2
MSEILVPEEDYPHTKLLPLKPLHVSALKNDKFEELYENRFKFFNPI